MTRYKANFFYITWYEPDSLAICFLLDKLKKTCDINSFRLDKYDFLARNTTFRDSSLSNQKLAANDLPYSHISCLLDLFFSFFYSTYWFTFILIKFSHTPTTKFFQWVHELRIHNILIGDCVLNSYLRGDSGRLSKSIKFLPSTFFFLWRYFFNLRKIKYSHALAADVTYFWIAETTYIEEAIRRYLLSYGAREIRFNELTKTYDVLEPLQGYELRTRNFLRSNYNPSDVSISKAVDWIKAISTRADTYWYLQTSDTNPIIDIEPPKRRDKTAVVFLHAISDAQFIFGVDCFIDLHQWLIETLRILRSKGYYILVKIHPFYYNEIAHYPSNDNYLNYLCELYSFDKDDLKKLKIIEVDDDISFVSHDVSVQVLKNACGDYVAISHHGTAVLEAAYLGLPAVVSAKSRYNACEDLFVHTYETIEEYDSILARDLFNDDVESKALKITSLLKFVAFHYVDITDDRIDQYFAKQFDVELYIEGFFDSINKQLGHISDDEYISLKDNFPYVFNLPMQ